MFKIDLKGQYTWPVTVEFATDGGKSEKHKFDATFKRKDQAALDELRAKLEAATISEIDLVKEILIDWKGIQDADGTEMPFSEEALDKVLNVFPVPACIVKAWLESLRVGRAKN